MTDPKQSAPGTAKADARNIAVQVLIEVHRRGAFASRALDDALNRHPGLDIRDRGLATELVYGCLRCHQWLRDRIAELAKRPLAEHDVVGLHLMVATYQLLLLDKIPDHAAVDCAVESVRELRGNKVAGFANAVLRRLAANKPQIALAEAAWLSAPAWLRASLTRAVGDEEARALLSPFKAETALSGAAPRARTCVRLRAGADEFPELLSAPPGRFVSAARWLERSGNPRSLPGFAEGAFVVQEEGSQIVGQIASQDLGPEPGVRILDCCAGHGSKALQIADRLTREQLDAELWVTDNISHKLEALHDEFTRLGARLPQTQVVDWTRGADDVPRDFACVLVDAPCSGSGTLWRRPEISLRLKHEHVVEMAEKSKAIIRNVAQHLKPGGRLLYAVCSVLSEEAEQVLEQVADLFEPLALRCDEMPGLVDGQQHALRLSPQRHGTDGFFIAQLARRG